MTRSIVLCKGLTHAGAVRLAFSELARDSDKAKVFKVSRTTVRHTQRSVANAYLGVQREMLSKLAEGFKEKSRTPGQGLLFSIN